MSTQTASVNSFGGCNQHSGWMRARSPNTKTISHSRPPRLRIMLKTGFRPPPDCLIKPLQVALANDTWMGSGCFSSPLDFFITANFSKASQQRSQFSANRWTSQFAFCSIYSFTLKGPIYCLQKRTKKNAKHHWTVLWKSNVDNQFSILSWLSFFFSPHMACWATRE